jgi:hypothetical protein
MRHDAFASHYMVHTYPAFLQEQTDIGVDFLRMTVRLKPDVVIGFPSPYARFLSIYSTHNKAEDPEAILRRIFNQIPKELSRLRSQLEWAIGYAYLRKSVRASIWGQNDQASYSLKKAVEYNSRIDHELRGYMLNQLVSLENEFGTDVMQQAFSRLCYRLKMVDGNRSIRWLRGNVSFNQALNYYRENKNDRALSKVCSGIWSHPRLILNRGALAILTHPIRELLP